MPRVLFLPPYLVVPGQAQVWRTEPAEDAVSGAALPAPQEPRHPQHHAAQLRQEDDWRSRPTTTRLPD